MEEFREHMRLSGYSKATVKSTLHIISLFMKWLKRNEIEVVEVQYSDMLAYMKSLQGRGLKQRTIQHYLNAISHYYNYIRPEHGVVANPVHNIKVKGVKRRKLYHILEPHELHSLYQNYPNASLRDKRNKVMLGLICYQGITTRELAELEVRDIDLSAGTVNVEGGRKSNQRTLELVSHQVMQLHEYVNEVRLELLKMPSAKPTSIDNQKDYLIVSEGARSQHFTNLITLVKTELTGSNSKFQSFRQIRASVITKWLKQHNKRKAQYLAGHRFISSTESYEQHDVEELKVEIERFHPLG